jgi:ribosomal protein S21
MVRCEDRREQRRKENDLSQVTLREGETQDSLLKRFNTLVQRSGVLRDAKKKRFFVSKGEAAREKQRRAASRRRRARS